MSDGMRFEAIIFDMDGVILDSMPSHCRAWQQALREVDIEVDELDLYLREGMKWRQTIAELAGERGRSIAESEADEIYAAKRRYFHDAFRPRFFPGARQGLETLRRLGYRLALVTGSTRDVVERVLDKGLGDMFEVIVTSDQIGRGKPSPEPYAAAIERLKTDPSFCLAVENSPAGIASAKAAGLTCYAVTTSLPEEHLGGADLILAQPSDVFDALLDSHRPETPDVARIERHK
jgi:HAD superfamily hydrolase (TIGR01509 family)